MAARPEGYGMTAELVEKISGKYNPELEKEAREWIAAILGEEPITEGWNQVHEALKDGTYLCRLINAIEPGAVKRISESKMAFKMMENIGNFLDACVTYGVPKTDLFQTVDLYEATNMPQVINGIHALGRKVTAKRPDLPNLGPKESTQNQREFTEKQLREGQGTIGLQMGSNRGASQAGMTPYGLGCQIEKTNVIIGI